MTNAMRRADAAWWRLIRAEFGGLCAYCHTDGGVFGVHSHHLIIRKYHDTRWKIKNGILLCADHHENSLVFSAAKTPELFEAWLAKKHPDRYAFLMEHKYRHSYDRMDVGSIAKSLEGQLIRAA